MELDGLRTVAAFGVVWIHVWILRGNPSLPIGPFDFYKMIAILGNGVDFFFVISGFCMYLMINKNFNASSYLHFIYKRFLRIAPAFFVSVLVYATIIKFDEPGFNFWYNVFMHLFFLNNVITGNVISGPFWSIGTEWHFYLVLPFLIVLSRYIGLLKTVLVLSFLSLLLACYMNLGYLPFDWWDKQILVRLPEFGVGIIACWFFLKKAALPQFMRGIKGLFMAFIIMYGGRFLQFEGFLGSTGKAYFLFKSIALPIMCIGFGLIMYHTITQKSILASILRSKVMTHFGKISYSVYLWHSLSIFLLGKLLVHGLKPPNAPITFILVSVITIVIAHFSYLLLESFYFTKSSAPVKNINQDRNTVAQVLPASVKH